MGLLLALLSASYKIRTLWVDAGNSTPVDGELNLKLGTSFSSDEEISY